MKLVAHLPLFKILWRSKNVSIAYSDFGRGHSTIGFKVESPPVSPSTYRLSRTPLLIGRCTSESFGSLGSQRLDYLGELGIECFGVSFRMLGLCFLAPASS